MNTAKKNWQVQTANFNKAMLEALQQQHHASQFVALAGRYLVSKKDDDSNTNMQFISHENMLLGNKMKDESRVSLSLNDLILKAYNDKAEVLLEIHLNGKTKQQVFDEFKTAMHAAGIKASEIKNELHYKLPEHAIEKGGSFMLDSDALYQNTLIRSNADIVLKEVAGEIDLADVVRIWPHHFDTGSFIPLEFNANNELEKSIGFGMAIPDDMVNEPYYYISFWSKKPDSNAVEFESLAAGNWMLPKWNGAVLRYSEIGKQTTAEEQVKMVKSFLQKGISVLMHHLKKGI